MAVRHARRSSGGTEVDLRLRLVPLVATLYALTACGSSIWDDTAKTEGELAEVDFAAVCADARAGIRVDDEACREAPEEFVGFASSGHAGTSDASAIRWYYVDARSSPPVAAVGGKVVGGSYASPKPAAGRVLVIVRKGSVPTSGGSAPESIQRGGLGSPAGKGTGGG